MEPNNEPGRRTWKRWRGSPALFTHIARVIEDAANREFSNPDYRISVYVNGDIEVFKTPEEFKANVTPEALRHFTFIRVRADGPTFDVELQLQKTRPAATFKVSSKDNPSKADSVVEEVSPAIARGVPERYQGVIFFLGVLTVTVVATISTKYLISAQSRWAQNLFHNSIPRNIVLSSPGVLYVLLFLFARPLAEVAELGQTRIWRMMRIIGPIIAGVIATAIAKWLLKS